MADSANSSERFTIAPPRPLAPGPKKQLDRVRAGWSIGVGLALIGGSIAYSYLLYADGGGGLIFGLQSGLVAGLCAALGIAVAWVARPRGNRWLAAGLWPIAAALALAMPVFAFLDPTLLERFITAGAETAGGLALIAGVARWAQSKVQRLAPARGPQGKKKVNTLDGDDGTRRIAVASLSVGDRIALAPGDDVPVDSTVESGGGFVEDKEVTGSVLPRAVKVGDPLVAGGIASIPDLVVRADVEPRKSLVRRRERLLRGVLTGVHDADRLLQITAGTVAVAVFATMIAYIYKTGFTSISVWMPGVAGVALAAIVTPLAIARAAARALTLDRARSHGWLPARIKDVDAIAHVRRWQIDTSLLAAPGSVEVRPIDGVTGVTDAELIAIAEALVAELDSPERRSISAERERREIEPLQGAALRRTQAVFHGTVDGQRWYLGPRGALSADEGVQVPDAVEAPLAELRDAGAITWLIGRPDVGVLGVLGVHLAAVEEVKVAAQRLQATLMPGLPDATRTVLARVAGLDADGPPVGNRDATLIAVDSERPAAGMVILVEELGSEIRLRRGGSPRLLAPGVLAFPDLVGYARRAASRARWVGLASTVAPALIASLLLWTGAFGPLWATGIGIAAVWFSMLSARPVPKPED